MGNKDLCRNHNMLGLCIKQGYVPSDCTLDGMIVFGLVQEGKKPCVGCNINCSHTQKSLTPLEHERHIYEQYCYEMENIKDKEKRERINKRKAHGNFNGFITIDVNYYNCREKLGFVITVINLLEEKMYIHNCKTIDEVIVAVPLICHKYKINQVIIDTHGFGLCIVDALNEKITDNEIDIIPMRATKVIF